MHGAEPIDLDSAKTLQFLGYEEFKKWNNNVEFIPDTSEAFMKLFSEKSDVYFVTGSLYLVGKIKEYLSTNLIFSK